MVQLFYGTPEAHVAIGKNRQRVYRSQANDNNVFLRDKDEFELELYNPKQNTIGIKIIFNGNSMSKNLLVLKPGERVWLDRYLDQNRKFLFETYEVENNQSTNHAIAKNGILRIEFYDEKVKNQNLTLSFDKDYWFPGTYTNGTQNINTCFYSTGVTNTSGQYSTTTDSLDININVNSNQEQTKGFLNENKRSVKCSKMSATKETGRISKGKTSSQYFDQIDIEFNSYCSSFVEYKILPESQKTVIFPTDNRQYCPECRSRIKKSTWKFCPTCGEKLD